MTCMASNITNGWAGFPKQVEYTAKILFTEKKNRLDLKSFDTPSLQKSYGLGKWESGFIEKYPEYSWLSLDMGLLGALWATFFRHLWERMSTEIVGDSHLCHVWHFNNALFIHISYFPKVIFLLFILWSNKSDTSQMTKIVKNKWYYECKKKR